MTKDRNMQSDKQGATTLMGNQDGIERRPLLETRGRTVAQGVELAVACLISYALIRQLLTRAYSVCRRSLLKKGDSTAVGTSFGTSTLKSLNSLHATSTDPDLAGWGCGPESESGQREEVRMTRIDPSTFDHETGMLVGANSAVPHPYEGQKVEWQELLARLSTGCKV
jgi:hypothetical protein